eukprot:tig00021462_g21605.t1
MSSAPLAAAARRTLARVAPLLRRPGARAQSSGPIHAGGTGGEGGGEGSGSGAKFGSFVRTGLKWGIIAAASAAAGIYAYDMSEYVRNAPPEGYQKQRVVVLGTGWAALAAVRELDTRYFDVTIVSPRNFFLFTPLLPSTAVGTIETRSIIEPIRAFLLRTNPSCTYLEAKCIGVDHERQRILCEEHPSKRLRQIEGEGNMQHFEVPYDHLVITVGAVNNTFGIKGVKENTMFLKELNDARNVRSAIMDEFERAAIPGHSEDEIRKLLHFVVVGGGPTGVEYAAELHDFIRDDASRFFPHLTPYVKITLIESLDHVLSMFSRQISDYAEKRFKRQAIEVQTRSRVNEVEKGSITVQRSETGEVVKIPFGLCVWSTGIGPNPLIQTLINDIPHQNNRRALSTDAHLRVIGARNVYAAGDCATIEQKKLQRDCVRLFTEADREKVGSISLVQFFKLVESMRQRYPHFTEYAEAVERQFMTRKGSKGRLTLPEFEAILRDVDSLGASSLELQSSRRPSRSASSSTPDVLRAGGLGAQFKSFAPTAQVANQQGVYLGRALNERVIKLARAEEPDVAPFVYHHFGSFAYIGSEEAVAELGSGYGGSGFFTWIAWRSAYLAKQVSLRNKLSVAFDWSKTILFGRDISRY